MKLNAIDVLNELKSTSGGIVKAGRGLLKMTQKELSELTGISVSNISKYENDKRPLGASVASKLAAALQIDVQLILFPNGLDEVKELREIRKKSERLTAKRLKKAS